ncbi:hypothetical protein Tco_0200192 [Tanacetum coccineum]
MLHQNSKIVCRNTTRFNAQSFQDAIICNMDSIGKYTRETILHQQRTPQLLKQKKLMQTQDHSNPIQQLIVNNHRKLDLVLSNKNTCSEKEYSNSKTASSKSVKESSLDSAIKDIIRPIYDEEPMAEVQLTAECNIFAIGQQHTEQPEIINEGRVDQWKPTGRIFKSVGLRWIPTGKLFDSCTSKDDGEPTHGSNVDIPNIHESKQTLDLSAVGKSSLFDPLFDEYFNGENQVVSKSSAVTTADASDKRQQQPDSTSSTSTLAITISADGNFDLNHPSDTKIHSEDENLLEATIKQARWKLTARFLYNQTCVNWKETMIESRSEHIHSVNYLLTVQLEANSVIKDDQVEVVPQSCILVSMGYSEAQHSYCIFQFLETWGQVDQQE